jgi:uncharacterized protein
LPTIRPALLTSPQPIAPSERIDGIDVLRGLALSGVLTINVVLEFRVSIFAQFLPPGRTDSAIDRALNSFLAAAVELKALALFSFLFGVGLAIQFDRLAGNPRRLVWQAAADGVGGLSRRHRAGRRRLTRQSRP